MAWTETVTVVAGQLMDAAFWNVHVRDNNLALRAGGLELTAGGLVIAATADTLGTLSIPFGCVPYYTGAAWVAVLWTDLVYPVGCILWSVDGTNPAAYFGGSWVAAAGGRMVVGVDPSDATFAAGAFGGTNAHALTLAELPAHPHTVTDPGHAHLAGISNFRDGSEFNTDALQTYPGTSTRISSANVTGITISGAGANVPHNNLPPYYVIYMWLRVA